MDDPVIRTITPDQGEVAALILAGLAEHWGTVDASLNPDVRDLIAAYPAGRTIVVKRDGMIIATGTVFPIDDETVEIRRMSVAPGHRHRGLGRAVVAELLATARRWERHRAVLETSSGWNGVVAFYRRCGFEITHHHDGAFGCDTWFAIEL